MQAPSGDLQKQPEPAERQSRGDAVATNSKIARIAVESTPALLAALAHVESLDRQSRAAYYATVLSNEDIISSIAEACSCFGRDPTFLQNLAIYVCMVDDSNGVHYSRPALQEAQARWVIHQMQLVCALTTAALEHDITSEAAAAALTAASTLVTKRHTELIRHVRAAAAYPPNKVPSWFLLANLVAAVAGMSKALQELTIRSILQQDKTALSCCKNMGERLLLSSRCCGFWMSKHLLLAADKVLCQFKLQPSSSEANTEYDRSVLSLPGAKNTARRAVLQLISRRWRVSQGEAAATRIGIINCGKPLPEEKALPC